MPENGMALARASQSMHADRRSGVSIMSRLVMACCVLLASLSAPARAAEICAWLVESDRPEQEHLLTLWLQSDAEIDFLYKVMGPGIVSEAGESNAPAAANYRLRAGVADSPWHYGASLAGAGKIDITVEVHTTPIDVFSERLSPLLARFVFKRAVPASETTAPATLANKQCTEMLGAN